MEHERISFASVPQRCEVFMVCSIIHIREQLDGQLCDMASDESEPLWVTTRRSSRMVKKGRQCLINPWRPRMSDVPTLEIQALAIHTTVPTLIITEMTPQKI
eukprot:1296619-Amphidinium_carterae.1